MCVLPPFSRTDTLPSPSSSKSKGILSHPGKRPTVTHVPTFKSARKMMSQWVFVAWPIFAKNNCILLQENIVLSHGHCCVALETGLVFYSRKRNCLWIPCPHAGRVDCSQISFQNSSGNFTSQAFAIFFNRIVMRPFIWSSHIPKTPLQMWTSSLFYLKHLLHHYHQLFFDIKRENILVSFECVSFID